MRSTLYLVIIMIALLVSACGGRSAATPIPSAQGDDVSPQGQEVPPELGGGGADSTQVQAAPTYFNEEGTPIPLAEVTPMATQGEVLSSTLPTAPPVGVLVAVVTEDPDAGSGFDYIYFEQSGGAENVSITMEVYGDGRLTINGEEQTARPQDMELVAQLIDEINFFDVIATFSGPPTTDEAYRYRIGIAQGARQRSISAQEGYIPAEFARLLSAVLALGEGRP